MKCTWVLPNLAFGPDPRVDAEFQDLKSLQIIAILSLQTDDERGDARIEGERSMRSPQSRPGILQLSHRRSQLSPSGLSTRQHGHP